MQRRLLLSALLTMVLAPFAAAQQAVPQQTVPQPSQPQRPAVVAKPKPKPATAKKPATVAAAPEAKARLLEKIQDWTVFIYEAAEGRVCFAASAPTDMQPKTAKRTPVIFYVTTWQKEGVHNEVSVRQGYAMKANAAATERNMMFRPGTKVFGRPFSCIAISTLLHEVFCVRIAPTIISKAVRPGHQCCGPYAANKTS